MSGVHGGVLGEWQLQTVQIAWSPLSRNPYAPPRFFLHAHAALRLDLPPMPTFEEQLVEHRVYLMRFA
ncbi:MAG: hypothetical protein Q8M93_24785, partial [Polaromonas sp.]|nr:hypothetical protein [Polaromonas sp.]